MKYIARLVLIVSFLGIGAGAGWICERAGIFFEVQNPIPSPAPSPASVDSAGGIDSTGRAIDEGRVFRKGAIALVIDDFGYERTETVDGFLMFPVKIACAVIPGQPDSRRAAEAVWQSAFELVLHLPMEPKGPSPRRETVMLKSGLPQDEVRSIIRNTLALFPGCAGVNNHMGSKGTEDAALMSILAGELRGTGLYFIDSQTTAGSVAYEVMQGAGVPAIERDVFLDHRESGTAIKKQLELLAVRAAQKGFALGIAHATKPLSLDVLKREIPGLTARGYDFVFPSDLLKSAKKRSKNF